MAAAVNSIGAREIRRISPEQASRIAGKFPLHRHYGSLETAMACAQWLKPDPVDFLERCGQAELLVVEHQDKLHWFAPAGFREEHTFLRVWLQQSGCEYAVVALLRERGGRA